jgi:hypothetical protein
MFKKLLLILAFSLPLFAQVPSEATYTSAGNIVTGATANRPSTFFIYRDSLWVNMVNEIGEVALSIYTWDPDAYSWTKITTVDEKFSANYSGSSLVDMFNQWSAYESGDTLIVLENNKSHLLSPPTGYSYDKALIYLLSTDRTTLTRVSTNNGIIWADAQTPTTQTSENFFIDGRPTLYGGDGGTTASDSGFWQLKFTNISTVMTKTKLTGNFFRSRTLPWETLTTSRDYVLGQSYTGDEVYLLSGKGYLYNHIDDFNNTDTMYVLQSTNSPYTAFNITDTLICTSNTDNMGVLWMGARDSITYFVLNTIQEDTAISGIYWISDDGKANKVTNPTGLAITGGFVSESYYVLFTTNQTNSDSNLTYFSPRESLSWQWLHNPDNDLLTQGVEIDTKILVSQGWMLADYQGWTGTLGGLDGETYIIDDILFFLSPVVNDSYIEEDIPIQWSGIPDTVRIYYSTNSGSSWTYITSTTNRDTIWSFSDILAEGISGTLSLRITDTDSLLIATTGNFTFISQDRLVIISPIDSIATVSVGDMVHINVRTIQVDSFSVFYSIDDSTNWMPIQLNLTPVNNIDTTTVDWILPNIFGTIYLLATENSVSDTVDITARIPHYIGENIPSQPQVCWYNLGGNIIEYRRYVDQSCGWGSSTTFVKVTSTINDDGGGYNFIEEDCVAPGQLACATTDPLRTSLALFTNGVDTTAYNINDYYNSGDTITYKFRRYYVGTDSIFYCDDLINGIDSLVIVDLAEYPSPIFGLPTDLTVYNVQRSKIQGVVTPDTLDVETLNDQHFIPRVFISGNTSRGIGALSIALLNEPADKTAVYDIVRIFTSLNMQRDYFRGIDPKARKKNR